MVGFANSNIWASVKKFKADSEYNIIATSVGDENTSFRDDNVPIGYTVYAEWHLPESD